MYDFPVEISRKRVKNINLRIAKNGLVKISAPLFCPQFLIERFLHEKSAWVSKHYHRIKSAQELPVAPMNNDESQAVLECGARQEMQRLIPPMIEKWEPLLGVQVQRFSIRSMKSRWGSCHPLKKHICLNLHLMKYRQECMEYVLVHEMVHLLEASHNQRFHALMTQFMPQWKIYKEELKQGPTPQK